MKLNDFGLQSERTKKVNKIKSDQIQVLWKRRSSSSTSPLCRRMKECLNFSIDSFRLKPSPRSRRSEMLLSETDCLKKGLYALWLPSKRMPAFLRTSWMPWQLDEGSSCLLMRRLFLLTSITSFSLWTTRGFLSSSGGSGLFSPMWMESLSETAMDMAESSSTSEAHLNLSILGTFIRFRDCATPRRSFLGFLLYSRLKVWISSAKERSLSRSFSKGHWSLANCSNSFLIPKSTATYVHSSAERRCALTEPIWSVHRLLRWFCTEQWAWFLWFALWNSHWWLCSVCAGPFWNWSKSGSLHSCQFWVYEVIPSWHTLSDLGPFVAQLIVQCVHCLFFFFCPEQVAETGFENSLISA